MHTIKRRARLQNSGLTFIPYANRLGRLSAYAPEPSSQLDPEVASVHSAPLPRTSDAESNQPPDFHRTASSPVARLSSATVDILDNASLSSSGDSYGPRRRKAPKRPTFSSDDKCHFEIRRRFPKHIPIALQLREIFWTKYSLLYTFIPIGFAVYYSQQSPQVVFSVNFLAIIASTMMIGTAADDLIGRVGNLVGGLLNVAVSNVPQLISAALLIKNGQYEVMKASLLGVILLNVLLVTGLSFFCGGYNRNVQYFNVNRGQTIAQFLLLAVLSIVLPTALAYLDNASANKLDQVSRGTAVIVIFSYALYLLFTLHTHNNDFFEPAQKVKTENLLMKSILAEKAAVWAIASIGAANAAVPGGSQTNLKPLLDDFENLEDPEWAPRLSWIASIAVLVISTTFLAFNTEFATSSIQGLLEDSTVTQQFLGLIIIPLLNCDPLPIQSAIKDGMDLSITITLDRCIQMAMVVIPMVVFIGWGMELAEVNLVFDRFVVIATFVAILIVTYTVQWGRTNWLIGALFIKIYVIIALSAWFINHPD